MFTAQVVFSLAWLARFRFGPFEWIWRSLTYMRWQPLGRGPGVPRPSRQRFDQELADRSRPMRWSADTVTVHLLSIVAPAAAPGHRNWSDRDRIRRRQNRVPRYSAALERMRMRRTQGYGLALLVTSLVVASGSLLLAAKFKSTWNAPGAGPLNFAGKKVVALVIADDQNLDDLVRGSARARAHRPRRGRRRRLPPDSPRGAPRQGQGQGMVHPRERRRRRRDAPGRSPQGDGLHARHVGVAILRFTVGVRRVRVGNGVRLGQRPRRHGGHD